ncbi:MAG TPA: NACHT domain-containing protein [Sedimentisphaerales bacterium]|nr:NACHT domain-containing protein [Sedimentisphaerales bacterium]
MLELETLAKLNAGHWIAIATAIIMVVGTIVTIVLHFWPKSRKEDKPVKDETKPGVNIADRDNKIDEQAILKVCNNYLIQHIQTIEGSLNSKMGNKDYYVEPVIVENNIVVFYNGKKDVFLTADKKRFVISCESGRGKTIFLLQYFIRTAKAFNKESHNIMPFCFHCRELESICENNIAKFLVNELFGTVEQCEGLDRARAITLMNQKIENGEILLLLDSFDQTAFDDSLKRLFPEYREDAFRGARVIIASRPFAVDEYPERFERYGTKLEIALFNHIQIKEYFRHFSKINTNKLRTLIENYYELMQVPMLMAVLAKIGSNEALYENLESKTEVYRMFCDKVVEDGLRKARDEEPNLFDVGFSVNDAMRQLQQIAYIAFKQGEIQKITLKTVDERIKEKVEGLDTADDFRTLCRFGIVYHIVDDHVYHGKRCEMSFKHQSFQAYFAAEQMVELLRNSDDSDSESAVRRVIDIEALLKPSKFADAWLEVLEFFAELPEVDEQHKLDIARKLLRVYKKEKHRKENHWKRILYLAAKMCSCLEFADDELQEALFKELRAVVEVGLLRVLEDDKPFRALSDIGKAEYIISYAINQDDCNAVNRFYSFRHIYPGTRAESEEITNACLLPESTVKLDYLFGLLRSTKEWSEDLSTDSYVSILEEVSPYLGGLLRKFDTILPSLVRKCFIKPMRDRLRHVVFYAKGNTLYNVRDKLGPIKMVLQKNEKRWYKRICDTQYGKWENYEDICMILLGSLANEKLVSTFYDSFLNKEYRDKEGLYKQAIAAMALAFTYPGDISRDQGMVTRITDRCIRIFNDYPQNIFRYYIARALATIGNQAVITYFLDFIERPDEEHRWYASMVLGCLNDPQMLAKLEDLSLRSDDRTKHFAKQALLVYNQTYME